MDKLQYVMDLMHRDFGCSTNSADYATESILLFRNELDRNLLPDFFDEINLSLLFIKRLFKGGEALWIAICFS